MITLRNFYKVGIYHYGGGISTLEEELLPLAYHSQMIIIQYYDLNRGLVLKDGPQCLNGHLVSPIPDYSNYFPVHGAHFGPDGSGQCKAHSSQASRGNIAFGLFKFGISTGDHLMLPNVRNNYGPMPTGYIDLLNNLCHGKLLLG